MANLAWTIRWVRTATIAIACACAVLLALAMLQPARAESRNSTVPVVSYLKLSDILIGDGSDLSSYDICYEYWCQGHLTYDEAEGIWRAKTTSCMWAIGWSTAQRKQRSA